MQLIVITPENNFPDEIGIVNNLFGNGLRRLHLRKPLYATEDYVNYIKGIDREYHSRIVIHGNFELYSEFGLGGIHLNSAVRQEAGTAACIKSVPIEAVSTSFHSWGEIIDNEFHYGYVFISPVFDSISKEGYKGSIDLGDAVKTRKQLIEKHQYAPAIVGLGGVGKEQVAILYERGFDGAAVLGAVWANGGPVKNFMEIRDVVKALIDG